MIRLYHFTLARFAPSIREHGLLSIAGKAEAGMYPDGWKPAPPQFEREDDLVWLTRKPDVEAGIQGQPDATVRVTVEVEEASRWVTAADRYGVPPYWREILRNAAQALTPGNSDRDWYVVEHHIPPERIVAIEEFNGKEPS